MDNACHNCNHIEESFKVETPDPVDKIQGTVEPQEEQIVGGDCLSFPSLTDHEKLRKNGH